MDFFEQQVDNEFTNFEQQVDKELTSNIVTNFGNASKSFFDFENASLTAFRHSQTSKTRQARSSADATQLLKLVGIRSA